MKSLYISFPLAIAVVAGTLWDRGQTAAAMAMPACVLAAPCGSTLPLAAPAPDNGFVCNGTVACQSCFFSGDHCFKCNSAKSYKVCVPGEGTCLDGTYTVDCGTAKKHQAAGSVQECQTCVGSGTNAGNCTKNSCHDGLVTP